VKERFAYYDKDHSGCGIWLPGRIDDHVSHARRNSFLDKAELRILLSDLFPSLKGQMLDVYANEYFNDADVDLNSRAFHLSTASCCAC
jgi:hypothetical protein